MAPKRKRSAQHGSADSDFTPQGVRRERRAQDQRRRRATQPPASIRQAPLARRCRDPSEYYMGPMSLQCSNCGAKHFGKEKKPAHPSLFLDCCDLGRIGPAAGLSTFANFPPLLEQFLRKDFDEGSEYRHLATNFRDNIRNYNASLAMASMTAHIESPPGRGPYCFRIHGQIYHSIGALYPQDNQPHRYGQLYILDTEQASLERQQVPQNSNCDPLLMARLSQLIAEVHPYARSYKMMAEVEKAEAATAQAENRSKRQVRMCFKETPLRGLEGRLYDLPTANEVAAIYVGGEEGTNPNIRNLVIHERSETLTAISHLDRACDPLTYPLLFPTGLPGWHPYLKNSEGKRITQKEYYSYYFSVRDAFNPILMAGKLFQQYAVDSFVKMEQNRLNYIRQNQKKLRADTYQGLQDFIQGDDLPGPAGRRIILPSTYIGSPRNLQQNYQDAMAIVARHGKPDIFITITCNPKWKEIQENLLPGQTPESRPDLIARVFRWRLHEIFDEIIQKNILGKVVAHVKVIEFQKRGLPHCHALLILHQEQKPTTTEDIDDICSAEIPDPDTEPRLHEAVKAFMIHRNCGVNNPRAPCARDGECSKKFPKNIQQTTTATDDGYPRLRRRGRFMAQVGDASYGDEWVVPFNPYLLLRYACHINVELCGMISAVKYLYKYCFKGSDRAFVEIDNVDIQSDEIKLHLNARYVCAPEALHRIFGFDLQQKSHSIQRLAIHLQDQQTITFEAGEENEALVAADSKLTTLTAYFRLNAQQSNDALPTTQVCMLTFQDKIILSLTETLLPRDEVRFSARDPRYIFMSVWFQALRARDLFYYEIPEFYTFHSVEGWRPRLTPGKNIIGRMYSVSPRNTERYALRILLLNTRGSTSFADLRTVHGVTYRTFVDAAKAAGFMDDDSYFRESLEEAADFETPVALRSFFACLIGFCEVFNVQDLWQEFRNKLAEDFIWQGCSTDTSELLAYRDIQDKLIPLGMDFAALVPVPDGVLPDDPTPAEPLSDLLNKGYTLYDTLNSNQKAAADAILRSVESETGGIFFIDGPGGSGKTYLYNTLYNLTVGRGLKVLCVAWTGIAANLLPHGKTASSAFKLNIHDGNRSSLIKRQQKAAGELSDTHMIIWDEVSMVPKVALEAVDSLLRDIQQNDRPFGGKLLLFGGDFRQTLPIVERGSPEDTVEACVLTCPLWSQVRTYHLTENIRARTAGEAWHKYLLQIGNGSLNDPASCVQIPQELLCRGDIVEVIFGRTISQASVLELAQTAILAPKNNQVHELNKRILDKLEISDVSDQRTYKSVDVAQENDRGNSAVYVTEYLNSLTPPGMPSHELTLKRGAIIMLLRNLDVTRGLCNGTRLRIRTLGRCLLQCECLTGPRQGERVFIPRIDNYCDTKLPFRLKRRQFPVQLAFAITINKSQGQSFNSVGLYLPTTVFSHGQLYVALSRVKHPSQLKIMTTQNPTKNIVIPDVLSHLPNPIVITNHE